MRRRLAVIACAVAIGAVIPLAAGTATAGTATAGTAMAGTSTAVTASTEQSGAATSAAATLAWTAAQPVPGLIALNRGGYASLLTVSCPSVGNCAAGGYYYAKDDDEYGNVDAFVVNEINGRWRTARAVPGLSDFDAGGDAQLLSVSCASAGNCSAGGYYANEGVNSTFSQPFVVTETKGRWGTAQPVPGLIELNVGGDAEVTTVSCGAAGDCAAGGYFTDSSGSETAFVVEQTGGRWGAARALADGPLEVTSVSCKSVGDCVAGGADNPAPGGSATEAYLVTETKGRWGSPQLVPGIAALTTGDVSIVNSVSCSSAGNCGVGGYYATDVNGTQQAFVANETRGRWGKAREVPGLALLNAIGGAAEVTSVSCAAAGDCTVGGTYQTIAGYHPFVAAEIGGDWRSARAIPGPAADTNAEPVSVSCGSAGNCGATGGVWGSESGGFAFLVNETDGRWGSSREIPWPKGRTPWYAIGNAISCVPAGECAIGGFYFTDTNAGEAFLVNRVAQRG
jgi:hypothetical protein